MFWHIVFAPVLLRERREANRELEVRPVTIEWRANCDNGPLAADAASRTNNK